MAWYNKLNSFDSKDIKGNDYSKEYVKNKNAFFYIGKEDDPSALIVLKPFLNDLTYSLKAETKNSTESITNANPSKIITGVDLGIKVSLNLPAVSVSEAKANAEKISVLMSWMRDKATVPKKEPSKNWCDAALSKLENENLYKDGGHLDLSESLKNSLKKNRPDWYRGVKICVAKRKKAGKVAETGAGAGLYAPTYRGKSIVFIVSFANLIQSGHYTEKHKILHSSRTKTFENMVQYGLRTFISNIKSDVDMDMGFFEEGGNLFPKSHKLSFNLEILNSIVSKGEGMGTKRNILGFAETRKDDTGGAYRDSGNGYSRYDIKSWPFGISAKSQQPKITNSEEYKYVNARSAFIKFKKLKQEIEFMPLLKQMSVERRIDKNNMHEFKHLTGRDRIVFDTKMPIYNLGFTVAAINLSHAKAIHSNMQKLMRMIFPPATVNTTTLARLEVMFSNLIGSGKGLFEADDFVQCICTSLNFKPNLDMGFFEEGGMLYIKSFDLSFSLEVQDAAFKG